MRAKHLPNIHPGEVLREEFLQPLGLSSHRIARELHVTQPRVNDVVLEKRGISADMALRLGSCFGTGAEFWMNLQQSYELEEARQAASADRCRRTSPPDPRAPTHSRAGPRGIDESPDVIAVRVKGSRG